MSDSKRNLKVMPLGALLPEIGDLSALAHHMEFIETRLEQIREQKEETVETSKETLAEEAMLGIVLQWLSVDSPGGDDS